MVRFARIACAVVGVALAGRALGQETKGMPGVEARLRAVSRFVDVGRPIWVEFSIVNNTDQPVTLSLPSSGSPSSEKDVTLPLAHIFSGENASGGLAIINTMDNSMRAHLSGFAPEGGAPRITLGPRASVGQTVDLLKFYPSVLRVPGRFKLTWQPYGGKLVSNVAYIDVAPLQQAEIITDLGTMTVRFYYDDAPLTVANFLELARDNAYNATPVFLQPGHYILCGDLIGDGTGIRKDGKKIPPEFNDRPHQKGSLSMALLEDDPGSASCQFFICNTRHADWDGKYTVFGQLVGDDSFAALDKIMAVQTGPDGRPVEELRIRSIRIANLRPEWADVAVTQLGELQTSSK